MRKPPHPIDVHVGNRVRMRRQALNLTQVDIANALGLTYPAIQNYETGRNRIGSSRLQQIASILQVPASFFFEGLETPVESKASGSLLEFVSSPDTLRLAKAFPGIKNKALRAHIIALVEEIASQYPELG